MVYAAIVTILAVVSLVVHARRPFRLSVFVVLKVVSGICQGSISDDSNHDMVESYVAAVPWAGAAAATAFYRGGPCCSCGCDGAGLLFRMFAGWCHGWQAANI